MKQAHYVLRYRQWMVDTHGERKVKAMERIAWRASPKFNREEVIQFARDIKAQLLEQENRIST